MRTDRKNIIVELSTDFALDVIKFTRELSKSERHISNQLFRSGTSIGANVREAQNAESKADFIHKLKIAAKEADESAYWLELCRRSEFLPTNDDLEKNIETISKILSKIISSSKKGKSSNYQIDTLPN